MRVFSFAAIGLLLAIVVAAFVGLRPQPARVPVRPAPATPLRATIAIAPMDKALTFARSGRGVAAQTIVVTRYQDGVVTGVDLTPLLLPGEDAIAAYNRPAGWGSTRVTESGSDRAQALEIEFIPAYNFQASSLTADHSI